MNITTEPFNKRIPKPWGEEIIYTPETLNRVGKILMIKAGQELSFQYHEVKEETLCLVSGSATLWLEDKKGEIQKFPMQLLEGYTILPNQKHRIIAVTDCTVAEVSSSEQGTTKRIDDKYNRPDETESMRAETNRGWHE